jgi:hypothetical protein
MTERERLPVEQNEAGPILVETVIGKTISRDGAERASWQERFIHAASIGTSLRLNNVGENYT